MNNNKFRHENGFFAIGYSDLIDDFERHYMIGLWCHMLLRQKFSIDKTISILVNNLAEFYNIDVLELSDSSCTIYIKSKNESYKNISA